MIEAKMVMQVVNLDPLNWLVIIIRCINFLNLGCACISLTCLDSFVAIHAGAYGRNSSSLALLRSGVAIKTVDLANTCMQTVRKSNRLNRLITFRMPESNGAISHCPPKKKSND